MAAAKSKTADKQKIVGKLTKLLKKEFGSVPKGDGLPVLETMLYAICLENSPLDAAQAAFDRLRNEFFDWNEVRVSTIAELEPVFEGLDDPEYRSMRVRYILYYVFDHQYSYDFDSIRRKTMELAQKQLAKIKHLTPFARNYLLQQALNNHVIPIDSRMIGVAAWLGLLPPDATEDSGSDALKSYVRKAEGAEFFWLLKQLSVHPGVDNLTLPTVETAEADEFDLGTAEARVIELLSGRGAKKSGSSSRSTSNSSGSDSSAKKKSGTAAKKKTASSDGEKKSASSATKKKTSPSTAKKSGAAAEKSGPAAEKKSSSNSKKKSSSADAKKKTTSRRK